MGATAFYSLLDEADFLTVNMHLKKWFYLPTSKLLALALTAGTVLTFILQSFDMNLFESYLYDFRMRHKGAPSAQPTHTVLINIDDKTVDRLNEASPLSIKQHIALLRALETTKPKSIAYVVNFNDSIIADGSESDQASQQYAETFVELADSIRAQGVPIILGTDVDQSGEVVPPFPLSKLPHKVAVIHKDRDDKVARSGLFSIYDEPVLHVVLASLFNSGKASEKDFRGIYAMPEIDAKYFFINYLGSTQQGRHPFTEISAVDLLDGKVAPEIFKDKIVLIASKTREKTYDYVDTPFSRTFLANSKAVVHANIIETLIQNNAIIRASRVFDFILTFILTTFIIAMVFRTTPTTGVLITTVTAAAITTIGLLTFRWVSTWICLTHPLIGIFISYYVFVPYRLIMEYKKRWEFQKKHEVLVQVEELKTNFMSLITHDLKTPVARIQGMAEILGRTGADNEIVSEILKSTDELNRFISSVLELAKIESNRIKLNKSSRDVNKIIEDCVRKSEFQARAKKISIETDLEPLFPIRVDVPLISKVMSNLIDNAIKYSPDSARVTVESRESSDRPGFIEVTVTDTGYGIAAGEMENLFAKFYRPKNDITMKTKGTGLGLYLSRYFVQLHNGSLTAESIEGKGSMFTILLPTDDHEEKSLGTNNGPIASVHVNEASGGHQGQKGDTSYV